MDPNKKPIQEFLENEEMWTQRAIDTPAEVIDELSHLRENQQPPNANRQLRSTEK
jgi:hypothetical protein